MNSSNLQLNNITNILLVTTTTIILVLLLIQQVAQAQAQQQQEPFYMIMKLGKASHTVVPEYMDYKVTDIETNMKNFNQGNDAKVEYNLDTFSITISDTSVYWTLPFKVIKTDTSNPNIETTTNGEIGISTFMDNYEKQYDKSTNITTYTGTSAIWINSEKIHDLDIEARIYANNNTGVLEMTQR